jgi:hypothetical protein
LTGNAVLAGLSLLAFHAACTHPYQFQFRDTFIEVALIAVALQLVPPLNAKGSWKWLAVVSVLGTLNRETWAFVLLAATAAACFEAGGARSLLRAPAQRPAVLGLLASALISLAVFLGVRWLIGPRPYYCKLWPWNENMAHILFWKMPDFAFGHGIWAAGAGVFVLWLLSVLMGNRNFLPFITGYLIPYLPATFLWARWMESRIFFPIFAIMIASLAAYASQSLRRMNSGSIPQGFIEGVKTRP